MPYNRHFGYKYSHFGEDTKGHDVKAFGDTTGKYVFWDASADTLYIVGALSQTGAMTVTATSGAQLTLKYDAAAYMTITQADGAGVTFNCTSDGTASFTFSDAVILSSTLNVVGVTQLGSAVTAALTLGGGTSASPLTTATADKNFLGLWTQSTATSGDSRGLYLRHYLGGTIAATGYGDAARIWTTVTGTGYSYASGVHATLSLNAAGTVTGSGAAIRATLGAAAASEAKGGQLAILNLDTDIGTGITFSGVASFIRLTKSGNVDVTTFMDIADDQCLKGSAATGAATNALPVRMPDGSTLYISLIAAS